MKILVLNAGSSSQKSCLFELGDALPALPPQPLWEAHLDWSAGSESAALRVNKSGARVVQEKLKIDSRSSAISAMLETLWRGPAQSLDQRSAINVVGHRVVHGGHSYQHAVMVSPAVRAEIAALAVFAPLHNRADLEGMEAVDRILGNVLQVAMFDTAFHSQMPAAASVYPGPYEWIAKGIRRYGFHGINHQYCARRAAEILGRELKSLRLITCHLGNGCSLAAVKEGQSVDTTMGFTPLEGLMMGTRSGSVDPGVLIHLAREEEYSAGDLEQVLNKKSGLLGISGLSNDMREILAARRTDPRAQLAFDIFVHRLRSCMGEMLASLGGLDAIVFTGGIGENSSEVRAAACGAFEFLGLRLDAKKNVGVAEDQEIAAGESAVRVLVVGAQEDWAIARECWKLVQKAS